MNLLKLRIAVDGLSGAGKGVLALALARHFSLPYLDTGVIYRVLALVTIDKGLSFYDEAGIVALVDGMDFFDTDLVSRCRNENVASVASIIGALPLVRQCLIPVQRDFAVNGAVIDGRDIGTIIMPDADFKFYVKAGLQQRAERRLKDLKEKGISTSLEEVIRDLKNRDERDMNRTIAPLMIADGSIIIDTSFMDIDEVLTVALGSIELKC